MLIQYSVKNFLSFKDEVTLSMVASKLKSRNREFDKGAVWSVDDDMQLLKCAVVYGANNSGKSNLIKSLRFLKQFVLDSSKESRADEDIKVSPFLLNPETEVQPSRFEVIFLRDGYIYQYEVSLSRDRVEDERLSRKALKKNAISVELFSRNKVAISVDRSFKEGKGLEFRTRANALFLSVCANFDGPISSAVSSWFGSIKLISGLNDEAPLAWTASKLDDPEFGVPIQTLLKVFDLGIDRFEAGDMVPGFKIEGVAPVSIDGAASPPAEDVANISSVLARLGRRPSRKVVSYHKMYAENGEPVRDVPFDLLSNESAGTKKLVALAGPIIDVLRSAHILIIDEFESRLHANVASAILGIFNSAEGNPNGAQLIAATHDTNLLSSESLRRDQVWFTGRDMWGRTSLQSLAEYRIRNDASFGKNYLNGDYGGVPYLRSELASLILSKNNDASK